MNRQGRQHWRENDCAWLQVSASALGAGSMHCPAEWLTMGTLTAHCLQGQKLLMSYCGLGNYMLKTRFTHAYFSHPLLNTVQRPLRISTSSPREASCRINGTEFAETTRRRQSRYAGHSFSDKFTLKCHSDEEIMAF